MRRFFAITAVAVLLGLTTFAPAQAFTAPAPPQPLTQFAACGGGLNDYLGLEPWYACLQKKYGTAPGDPVQIHEFNDIWLIVLPLLEDTVRLAAYIAAGFVIWGGFKYMKSQGNPSELSAARDIIRNAIIGLLWTVLSVAVVDFVSLGLIQGQV